MSRMLHLTVALLLVIAPASFAQDKPFTQPKVKIQGKVLTTEGKPAAGAKVIITNSGNTEANSTCNERGEFELEAYAALRPFIFASNADYSERRFLQLPMQELRAGSNPFTVQLFKSIPLHCKFVNEAGAPVEGVEVCAYHHIKEGMTSPKSNADGKATLFLYSEWSNLVNGICGFDANKRLYVADPNTIISAVRDPKHADVIFTQIKSKPKSVRVVDDTDQPVSGLRVTVSATLTSGIGAYPGLNEAAAVTTNANGEATIAWLPQDLKQFYANFDDPDWKASGEEDDTATGVKTLRVSKRVWMEGKISGPPGVNFAGLCIAGDAHNGTMSSDIFAVRCDAEGRFRFRVASNHVVRAEVIDNEWSAPFVAALSPATERDGAEVIHLKPENNLSTLTVNIEGVSTSQDPKPLVEIESTGFFFDPVTKKKVSAGGFAFRAATCNDQGIAQFHLSPGKYRVRTRLGDWMPVESVEIKEDTELHVELPNMLARKVTGQVIASKETLDSLAGKLEVTARAIGTTQQPLRIYEESPSNQVVKAQVDREGKFSLTMVGDFAQLYIKSTDGKWQTLQNVEWSDKPSEISLQPAATLSGILLDSNNHGIADTEIRIVGRTAYEMLRLSFRTDAEGRFTALRLPPNTALTIIVDTHDIMLIKSFDPGEVQADLKINTRPVARKNPPVETTEDLDARIQLLLRDAKLGRMGALVILEGDGEKPNPFALKYVEDGDANASVYEYTVVRVTQNTMKKPGLAEWMKEQLWTLPEKDQIGLVLLAPDGRISAQSLFPATPTTEVRTAIAELLNKHVPAKRNALVELDAALAEAKRDGKKVLVKTTGTRCYPCTLLARWLDDHKALLERDYIIFSFDDYRDEEGEPISKRIGAQGHGIPYFVIMNAEGEVEINSVGMLGNIGMASGREGKRHLRKMLSTTAKTLTEKEIDTLIAALEDDE